MARLPRRDVPLLHLLPNVLTIAAIAAGLSAIREAVDRDFSTAVLLLMAAAVLDGVDGRLARLLGSHSPIGAELDSLADFVNFGVAAPLLVYFWALHDLPKLGWTAVLIFAVCCVLRLARFNVAAKTAVPDAAGDHFVGIPSPAGAMLLLLPLFLSFATDDAVRVPDAAIAGWTAAVGIAMISTLRVAAFKEPKIATGHVRYALLAVAVVMAALLSYPWATLVAACVAYIAFVALTCRQAAPERP
ncbi:CDP-diacylglycerol---serine O-phosphatidyltransferase [Loktanella fryxellensis]|uniref:CDP-diacylglycerol---serine O-phosphatidyltransferase n=1 Tax=Loktanella fryxellensis TaxID=245187 RepID=A0A1H8FBA3_9RHOB|nr:phosphatidylcholine/phosphatidylserine synthase [Loktanella fryxellensis]SEN28734.1 CDP-diacylglycerol---serine O-phosphatidyltransferase [Loktanella fryxellensis]